MENIKEKEPKLPVDSLRVREFNRILDKYRAGRAMTQARIIASENWWKLRNSASESDSAQGSVNGFVSRSAWLHNVIVSKHADGMEAYPQPVILPREPSDTQEAQMLSSIIPCLLEQNHFEQVYSAALWQKLKTGTGVYKVVWDSEKLGGMGDIAVEGVNLLNLFWEPGITDIQSSRYLFHIELTDGDLLSEAYPDLDLQAQGRADDGGYYLTAKAAAVYSALGGANVPRLSLRYRTATGDYGAEIPMESGKATVIGGEIQPTQTYFAEITLRDTLGFSSTYTQPIPTATVFFHGRKGGKGAAFGKYAEADGVLEIDWGLKVQGRSLLDWLHPVGSIYISDDATSPAQIFGGDWLQLKDVFLLAAGDTYKLGTAGGEASTYLTVQNMPRDVMTFDAVTVDGWSTGVWDDYRQESYASVPSQFHHSGYNTAHNNMPPYRTVNVWKRMK